MRKRTGILRALISSSAALASAATLMVCVVSGATAQLRTPASQEDLSSPSRSRYEALRAYREGRYADALKAAANLPNDPDVLLLRGRAAEATGDYAAALTAFEAAAAKHP